MRSRPILAGLIASLLLVLAASWWHLAGPSTSGEDAALAQLDQHAMAESALHTALLSARNGMLRNYDPLTSRIEDLNLAIDTLERIELEPAIAARVANLRMMSLRQEQTIEQFKTQNALLQNSLVHFGIFTTRLNDTAHPTAAAKQASALATAMLRLTLDTSPAVGADVDSNLLALSQEESTSLEESRTVEALLAHARLLRSLLPEIDAILQEIFSTPSGSLRENIRTLVLERRRAAELAEQRFRYSLYVTSVLLSVALIWVGLRLRRRSLAMRRRAAIEHVLAGVSTRFINSSAGEISALVERSLEELAACLGAQRAYFIVAAEPPQIFHASAGPPYPADWPTGAVHLARQFRDHGNEVICVPDTRRHRYEHERAVLEAHEVRSWICVQSRGRTPGSLLGFDFLVPPPPTYECERALLRMMFDAVANAVERDVLERERAQLETNLRHARRMETLGALTSGIAHNFNNIVGAILGFAETAQGHGVHAEELTEIRRAGERARELVGQILAFGRRAASPHRPARIGQLVAEAQSLLRASLPPRVKIVVTRLGEEAWVNAEPTQLQQVILNLCNNAAQAMGMHGCIHIHIDERELMHSTRVHQEELPPGRYCVLSVSDTGHGMSEAVQARIFEPFFTTRADGNGLGLATAHEIVLDHGGAIAVNSAPGRGTRFYVWLPYVRWTSSSSVTTSFEATTGERGRGETIMLLEPERERRLRLEEILAALGYEPVGYSDVTEISSACLGAPTRFDAALISARTQTAAQTIEHVAAVHRAAPKIPIILATAARHMDAQPLTGAGITAIIGQPPTLPELAAALSGSLNPQVTAVAIHPADEI